MPSEAEINEQFEEVLVSVWMCVYALSLSLCEQSFRFHLRLALANCHAGTTERAQREAAGVEGEITGGKVAAGAGSSSGLFAAARVLFIQANTSTGTRRRRH